MEEESREEGRGLVCSHPVPSAFPPGRFCSPARPLPRSRPAPFSAFTPFPFRVCAPIPSAFVPFPFRVPARPLPCLRPSPSAFAPDIRTQFCTVARAGLIFQRSRA